MGMGEKSSLRRMWVSVTPKKIFLNGPLFSTKQLHFGLLTSAWVSGGNVLLAFKFNQETEDDKTTIGKTNTMRIWLIYW